MLDAADGAFADAGVEPHAGLGVAGVAEQVDFVAFDKGGSSPARPRREVASRRGFFGADFHCIRCVRFR